MKRVGREVQIAFAALLLWPLLLSAGCEAPGGHRGFTSGRQGEEEIWAIRCITLQGPRRFEHAAAYADALKQVSGLKAKLVQVLSDEDGSSVFYGRYRRVYGAEAANQLYRPNHLRDLETIRALRLPEAEVWPFILATMDVLPTFRSEHPEWNLANADGYWALHVAVFYNMDTMRSRRSAAEEYCRLLRAEGEPAYFHHSAVNSSVYIDTYPEEAVVEIQRENPFSGRRQVTTKRKIVDPRMLEAQRRFPISLHNGHKLYEIIRDRATDKVRRRLSTPSFPVIIPQVQRQLDQFGGP